MKRRRLLLVAVFALAGGAAALAALARLGRLRRPAPGPVKTIRGLRVLVLDGTPREQGFTQGYHLAADIMAGGQHYISTLPVLRSPALRDSLLKLGSASFLRPERYHEEIRGIFEGMKARLGEDGLHLPALGRKITVDDLWALNTSPDWHRGLCSSFSAWGGMTAGGRVLTGRNLDYSGREVIDRMALVIVRRHPEPERRAWVGLAFAGTIGCYSGMNSDGLVLLTHDSDSTGRGWPPYYPQALALRECIETVAPGADPARAVASVLRRHRVFAGSNVHVSSADSRPAIAEYDGNWKKESGVTLRRAPPGQDWLACTNDFLDRQERTYDCWRYRALARELGERAASGRRILGLNDAWRVAALAGVDHTLHTAVFAPAERLIYVANATPETPAHQRRPVVLSVDELLELSVKPAHGAPANGDRR